MTSPVTTAKRDADRNVIVSTDGDSFAVAFAKSPGAALVVVRVRSHRDPLSDVVALTVDPRQPGKALHAVFAAAFPDATIRARSLLIKRVRAVWHDHQRKECLDALSPRLRQWAETMIADESRGYDCVDSERVARVGKTSQMRRFVRTRSCCGSHEWEAIGPDGFRYLMGFNYGH